MSDRYPRAVSTAPLTSRAIIRPPVLFNQKGGILSRPFFWKMHLALLAGLFPGLTDGDGLAHVAHLEAGKALHRDVLAQLTHHAGDQLVHRHGLVLDEGLLVEADVLVELAHLALDDLLHHLGRLAGRGRLRAVDV